MLSTSPIISSTDSPFTLRPARKAPSCAGAARPCMICSIAHAACPRSNELPEKMIPRTSGQVEVVVSVVTNRFPL
jgi:hypothetical protein